MLTPDVFRQVRRLRVLARRAVAGPLGGAYRSAFHGTGLGFTDVREYVPGDDVRRIDWLVTARTGRPFARRFAEDRELTVLLVVDLSASLRFGTELRTKRQTAAELAALVGLAAVSSGDRVGLVGFTDQVERYVPPGRGPRHAVRVLRDVLAFAPTGRRTDVAEALRYVGMVRRRRAVVFVVSDFGSDGYGFELRRAAARHDLIAARVVDPRELAWPDAGLVRLEDAETGRQVVVDTSGRKFRDRFRARAEQRAAEFGKAVRAAGAETFDVSTADEPVDALVRLFRRRTDRR